MGELLRALITWATCVHGKVLRVASFGAFVEIAEGVEGLCHNSEAADANGQPMQLEPGAELDFKIIKMSPEEKKVGAQHSSGGRRSLSFGSRGLQTASFKHRRLYDRRVDVVETRQQREQLAQDHSVKNRPPEMVAFLDLPLDASLLREAHLGLLTVGIRYLEQLPRLHDSKISATNTSGSWLIRVL